METGGGRRTSRERWSVWRRQDCMARPLLKSTRRQMARFGPGARTAQQGAREGGERGRGERARGCRMDISGLRVIIGGRAMIVVILGRSVWGSWLGRR
ncbi:hypothetical protein K505DRAFT_75927 [Melanomma pulvis-pyrius CBS 109.77]|uniref:Uncharacterized protein n=1 Tax=Melanomma pulvis-pyrius CBS 109.77 TaxID=1314802 RepID=A0A6A6XSD2_9PLEO|nr:hypothetical protein K505DRAFT_75927 [Melanomma pulvis-pyrius CBS 109.77]